jgi:hypothetical protein
MGFFVSRDSFKWGRVATGDDITNVVAFLLSPDAETLSGTVIDVGCFAQQGSPVPAKPAP